MKDAFGNSVDLGDKILYSTGGSAGTMYVVGTIAKVLKCKPNPNKNYYPPDRVEICPEKTTKGMKFAKNPVLYSSNVVKLSAVT